MSQSNPAAHASALNSPPGHVDVSQPSRRRRNSARLMHQPQRPRWATRVIMRTAHVLMVDVQTAESVLILVGVILLIALVAVIGIAVTGLTYRPTWQ
jgi:hypothetical protein